MALHIEIPSNLSTRIVDHASELGVEPEEYVSKVIERDLPPIQAKPLTGAELVEKWKNLRTEEIFAGLKDSPELARRLRREAEQR